MTETQGFQGTWTEPVIPSKWEIVPIHNSDRSSFKGCRRRWDWSSPARQNLVPRVGMMGVNTNLWFGTGIHYALEQYYNPILKRDPVESWKTWFDVQWRGGTVTEDWLDKTFDLSPKPVQYNYVGDINFPYEGDGQGPLYTVRGLEDILPDPDHLVFDELFELGIGMMTFYRDYAAKNDDFEVLMVEHDFSVPIWDYANERILRAVDKREDSPNYGKELEVHARGRMDALTRRVGTEKLSVMDHKTASTIKEEYFLKLESDEQVTSYLLCAQIEASYYDLPHKGVPLEECLYNTLRKKFPSQPTELKNGMFSVDRENEAVTYDILMDWIASHMPGVPLNEKQQGYVDWLRDVGDEQFIIRKHVRRNQHQLRSAGARLYLEALDMLADEVRTYPNLNNDWSCLNCVFRPPCLAREDGSDWQQLINDNYTSNRDR